MEIKKGGFDQNTEGRGLLSFLRASFPLVPPVHADTLRGGYCANSQQPAYGTCSPPRQRTIQPYAGWELPRLSLSTPRRDATKRPARTAARLQQSYSRKRQHAGSTPSSSAPQPVGPPLLHDAEVDAAAAADDDEDGVQLGQPRALRLGQHRRDRGAARRLHQDTMLVQQQRARPDGLLVCDGGGLCGGAPSRG